MKTPEKRIILVDGSSYLYRAFHALPPLTNSQGEPTGAIYGVINMIRKLLKDYNPDYIAVVFDPKGKTHRDEIYPYYKAARPPMADELRVQIQPLHEIIQAMGLPLLIVEGEEADDVIGTLTKEAERQNISVLISTGDKDMAQLVNNHVMLINTMTNVQLDRQGVIEKFGVPPERIVDYLTLMGDSVDNIPGVPKVGPKTAAKWIQEFGSLDNVVANADKISGKVGEYLREALDKLPLSRELLTIRSNLSLNIHPKDLIHGEINHDLLTEWFRRFEFRTWLSELLEKKPGEQIVHEYNYKTINTEKEFNLLWERILKADKVGFDTETTGLDFMNAEIVGASFALMPQEAFYIPVGHDYLGAPNQLSKEFLLKHIKLLLEDPNKIIIGHNLKYDINVLYKYGIRLRAKFFDTMLESYVLNSVTHRHDMDSLAMKYLERRTILFEDIAGKGTKQLTCNQIPVEKTSPYACQDADVTLQLHQLFWEKIAANPPLERILSAIELPLMPLLSKMECTGVLVDIDQLQQLSKEFGERIEKLEKAAFDLAGKKFNLASPKQLQEILYQQLKIPVKKLTPTGQPSTSESVLQDLALQYALPKVILEHRSLSKLKSTYTDALVEQIDSKTGRVHTSYNQAVTSTGRLSSTEPNLQNIPIRTEEGRRIRQAFIAPKGYKIISADYSQIELRIMAHLSQDAGLLKAFSEEADIHRATAAEVFGTPLEKVTSMQRRSAKAINFGLMYGMSTFGLSSQLGISHEIAQQYIDLYFSRYPAVKHFMDNIRNLAHQQGYVETFYGRRLYLPEINVSNMQRRRAAERAAINAPMQGTAADIIKIAMTKVDEWITQSGCDIKMLMQVHDELVFEVAEDQVEKVIPFIRENMTKVVEMAVPIMVEIGVGNNWDEAHA